MKSWTLIVLGALLVLIGGVWGLQGWGHLQGSPMTGVRLWGVLGPVVLLAGIGLLVWGIRGRRTR
ncbi:hypothetical protein HDA32_004454 [Spinactinospora alkalitolerans]|uniref:Uncharacterized protein n=1 Tax=Spinactinospora alkalitolerans TaxID=687207 RepID=A0A852U5H9_9ACTN|nr:hypothetical protein [Spinactinospora alkalitolerans]NYE49334.1 hypothetical protein [Spinactinospora alkalitolerans]